MSCFKKKDILQWLGVSGILLSVLGGCAQWSSGKRTISPLYKKYTLTVTGNGWEPVKAGKEDMALWNKQSHAMMAFITSDLENKKYTLEILNTQLFIGLKGKKILSMEPVTIGNQKAMHTILTGEMDNQHVKIDSYVIRTKDHVYDLLYWSPSDSFEDVRSDFENAVKSFKLREE
ncbi:MAG TPA: hypothetical protein ACFYDZ_09150 [Candidatus Brocadiaceae bacterium]